MSATTAADMVEMAMLELNNVSRHFGAKRAVDSVTLAVPKGQMVGVIGRSGAGKSTLLRMINRLADPTAGCIRFDGADVTNLRGEALLDWRRRAAMVFQQFNLVGRVDVMTNVLIGRVAHVPQWRSLSRTWSSRDRAIAFAALEQFDIAELAAQRADTLSGGQQQRVAICRALVQEPDLILADEPIASLDPRNTKIVMDALRRVNNEFGITVICNLHSLDLARGYCGRLIGMANGRVVFDGPPDALTEAIARDLYGLEANEAVGSPTAAPTEFSAFGGSQDIRPALVAA
jgi:phosphonate transport system ATP-binding protein